MIEGWVVNGASISNLAYILTDASGAATAPGRRGDNIPVPGRHGELRTVRKPYDVGTVVLLLTVAGCLPDGSVPGGSTEMAEFFARADALLLLFSAETVTLDHTRPDGSVRRCVGEVTAVMDFTRVGPAPIGRISIAMTLYDPFWADISPVTTGALTWTSGQTRTLSAFAGASAPMADLDILITGPANNPEVRQPATSSFIAYDGLIGAGQTLTIRCDDTVEAPLVGTGGLVPDYTKIRYLPPRWFDLTPAAGLDVQVVHTGGGSVPVTISGRRKHLIG